MGKTWSGPDRKRFGKQKTKRHRSRSKWSSKNGGRGIAPRLRTLAVDIAEFRLSGGEVEVPKVLLPTPSPTPPKAKKSTPKRKKSRIKFDRQTSADSKEKRQASSFKGIGESRKVFYDSLTTAELRDRVVFYTKQCQSLTATARGAQDTGDLSLARKVRAEKYDFFIPEMNTIRLYLERFR